MNEALLNAYRYQRGPSLRGYYPTAKQAIEAARDDVANGKSRYPSARIYPAVTWQTEPREHDAIGTWSNPFPPKPERIGYVDSPERCGLREVDRVMPECGGRNGYWDSRGDCGWHTDPHGYVFKDGTGLCFGVVYQLPGRDGKARFVAGYQFDGTDGGPTIDFSTIYEEDCRDNWCNPHDYDAAHDAARAADSMAQAEAEKEREYQTAWQAGNMWADVTQEIAQERESIKADLATRKAIRADMRRAGVGTDSREWSRACAMVRASIRCSLDNIQELRDKRDKLASGDWDSLIFYPSETLRAAFNEGAGEAVI